MPDRTETPPSQEAPQSQGGGSSAERSSTTREPAPSPPRRTPTGLKVLIGCGGLFVLLAIVAVVVVGVGGLWLKDKADDVVSGLEERADQQREASDILNRLARERPFTPPADGRIDPLSAERFLGATDASWAELEPFAERMAEISQRARDDRTGFRDVIAGARGAVELADSRLILARALEAHDLSIGEYVWTGQELLSTWERAQTRASSGRPPDDRDPVRAANEELAGRHADRLAGIDRRAETANPAFVLDLALLWSSELPTSPRSTEPQGESDE